MRNSVQIEKKGRPYKDDIILRFTRMITLGYNLLATALSVVFLVIFLFLKLKNPYITIALIALSGLNLGMVFLSLYVFYQKKHKKALSFVKTSIKLLRLSVTAANMILTLIMWFTKYSGSAFMTVMVVLFTIFYAIALLVQLFILCIPILFLAKKKKKSKKERAVIKK